MRTLINFFYELGILRNIPRSGWQLLGIQQPESVADHSFRTAIIAYCLGVLEGVNAERAALMALLHDVRETRTGDLHKVAQRYITPKEYEDKIHKEQAMLLPEQLKEQFLALLHERDADESPEAQVVKDADYLEVSLTAKEYIAQGFHEAQDWINNSKKLLKTKTAKQLMEALEKSSPTEWWHGLKNIKR